MKLSPALKLSLGRAADKYHEHVELAASYLEARGLWDEGVATRFRLGVVVDPVPEHRTFTGRLSIPYLTPTGVVGLKFRCIRDHDCDAIERHAKYVGLELEDRIYNVQALHDARDRLYIAEGELDALSLSVFEDGQYPCVGISGAKKWKPHYSRLFEDFSEVIVFAEGDDSGREFGSRIREELPNARVVLLPDGEDINSLLQTDDGVEDFDKLLA